MINHKGCQFGLFTVDDVIESNSGKVLPTDRHTEILLDVSAILNRVSCASSITKSETL